MTEISEKIVTKLIDLHADSTCHGFRSIFKTKLVTVRIMWIASLTALMVFCAWLTVRGISSYLSYEVNSKIRINYHSGLVLPKISICNTKPFLTQYAYEYFINQAFKISAESNIKLSSDLVSVIYGNYTNSSKVADFIAGEKDFLMMALNRVADPSFNQTNRAKFGLENGDFILNSSFALNPLTMDYYRSYYDPYYGNCVQLNSGYMQNGTSLPLLEQTLSGYRNGYIGIFFMDPFPNQSYNFMNLLSSNTFGLRISIDDQKDIIMSFNKILLIKPGACTSIALRKSKIKNLPQPYSSCQDLTNYKSLLYDKFVRLNKTYSKRVCYELCKQMQTILKCNCSFINYPNLDHYPTCGTLSQVECARSITVNSSDCDLYCPLECESTSFEYSISSDFFPDDVYYEILSADPRVKTQFANAGVKNVTYDELANSLACLLIFFDEIQTTKIEELEAMSVIDLFAYLGGTIGLCCGMSVLSFCELFEVLIEIVHIVITNKKKQINDESSVVKFENTH